MDESHSRESTLREKLLEHAFVTELMKCLWRKGIKDIDVLRPEVDRGGYDVVISCSGVNRYIQLKASHLEAKTSRQKVNANLATRPGGCVIWMKFDAATLAIGPFLWFGGEPGAPCPAFGDAVAKHVKGDREGVKALRPNIRILKSKQFKLLQNIEDVAAALFGQRVLQGTNTETSFLRLRLPPRA